MRTDSQLSIQVLVFSLVAATFTTVYITQPVLPVIQDEFAVDARTAYLGGAAGITACGYVYDSYGWNGTVGLGTAMLLLPLGIGLIEIMQERKWQVAGK